MASEINGRDIARVMRVEVKEQLEMLKAKYGRAPKLVFLTAGGADDTKIYVKVQQKTAQETGIDFDIIDLGKNAAEKDVLDKVDQLNKDESVTAVIVQHPLPEGIDHGKVVAGLIPEKDAEGIHFHNLGKLFRKEADIVPCTPGAVMKILRIMDVELYGKNVVILGHSPIVGKPLSMMMLNETATTSVCHIGTAERGNITDFTGKADILVVAVGRPEMVKADWVQEGVIVIDVGINNVAGRIVGDVSFDEVKKKASAITPVPGGVGPVTVSILMRNVIRAFRLQNEKVQGKT